MKPRPRKAENRIAEELNKVFGDFTPIERIPVLGRTGPDLTINELGLVVDVKSRKSNPKKFLKLLKGEKGHFVGFHEQPGLVFVRLSDVGKSITGWNLFKPSKTVEKYWMHMNEWTEKECPENLTAIVLHRPGMAYADSLVVMHINDRRELLERIDKWKKTTIS